MAPQPKPPGQRRRRNADQSGWRTLPADGVSAPPPEIGFDDPLQATVEWWGVLWASPMASVFVEADVDSLRRLAQLKDEFSRGDAPATALSAIQQLEDRFGLSPKARRALQWEVAQASPAQTEKPRQSRRLHAVDSRAVSA